MLPPEYLELTRPALERLLVLCGGNKTQLAAVCKVSRNAVSTWFNKGYVGRSAAMRIDADPTIPMTKEELRPDVRVWSIYKQPMP